MTDRANASVHDESSLLAQRWKALAQDHCILCALGIFGQIFVGSALFVYAQISTPGWLSLLLTLPLMLGMIFWARRLAPRAASAADKRGQRLLGLLPAAVFFLDAALAFLALCALFQDVLPDWNPRWIAGAAALLVFLSLTEKNEFALPRLARLIRVLIAVPLLFCACTAVPHGSIAHFFPLLGYGVPSILQGTLWLWGAEALCVWPLLMPQAPRSLSPLLERPSLLTFSLLRSVLFGMLSLAVSVWLMPVYALSSPRTLGWKLLLVIHMTPSVPAWSLAVIGLSLLLLFCLSSAVKQCALLVARAYGQRHAPMPLLGVLLALVFFLGAWPSPKLERLLMQIAPGRAALMVLFMLLVSWTSRTKRRKEAAA